MSSQDISQRIYLEEVLRKQATTDFLTGIHNRLKITEELEIELNRVKRYGGVFGLAMFDLDHFKAVNDTYGHDIGDYVLKEMTTVISKQIRKSDRFGRWGGEEFIIILPELSKEHVVEVTQKLTETISRYVFQEVSQITISFGVTISNQDDTKKSILKRIDDALYKAKEEGRNRVVFH